ncbi:MAG: hypothetical protein KO318_05135 [Methanobacterium sp.]|uniref:hypothetical protein n=1 Tax=Methanobacterium TaxID=2160 RepID=UPI0012FD8CC5|nr:MULTISPECIES: hypothetical protein [Methanobacterium]MCC7559799.1 hypothetical protein [Methanobacterium sp.]
MYIIIQVLFRGKPLKLKKQSSNTWISDTQYPKQQTDYTTSTSLPLIKLVTRHQTLSASQWITPHPH